MPVRCELTETVATTPALAFAAIDDLPLTAQWLPPCVSLEKLGTGPNAPGDKLRYVFREGGKQAEMAGTIVERVPGERLFCRYGDASYDVSVDLRVAAAGTGTRMTHAIEIAPKTFLGKLMQPLIRLGLGAQTRAAADNLKKLLEAAAVVAAMVWAVVGCQPALAADDGKSPIDGIWLPVAMEFAGQPFPEEARKGIVLEIVGEAYTVTVGKEVDKGTVKVDAAATPVTIDIVGVVGPNKGKTILGIVAVEKDTLRVCYDFSGKDRPTEFKTAEGTQHFLVTYERQKP